MKSGSLNPALVSKLHIAIAFVLATACFSFAGTYTIPAGSGTLTYTETTHQYTCVVHVHYYRTYNENDYSSFSYTDSSGTKTVLSGGTYSITGSPGSRGTVDCPDNADYPVTFIIPTAGIVFTPVGTTGGSATVYPAGVLYPKYKILSIIYDAPGNRSCNGYTSSTTDGATTSIGNSFQVSDTETYSQSVGLFGLGGTLSMSYGTSTTTGNSSAFTDTISQATGVENCSVANTINHSQDLFVLWLNPSVTLIQTGSKTLDYGVGTQVQTTGDPNPGQPEATDAVEITAQTMMANAQGVTTVPLEALVPQIIDGQTLPGLANICANPLPPAQCTQANQCGCVPSDFEAILNEDPLLNSKSTDNPLNVDTSGATACTNPTPSAQCRYVPVMTSNGSDVQVTELLAGPECAGCNVPVNSFTQSDSTESTETLSEVFSYSMGFSWSVGWNIAGNGISLQNATQFTWTNTESTGAINGQANSMAVSFSSSTVDCYQEIPIFEDTVYHTFVFQQPANNNSCPN
jgi:hypothetical protein